MKKKSFIFLLLILVSKLILAQNSFIHIKAAPGASVYVDNELHGVTSEEYNGLLIRNIESGYRYLKIVFNDNKIIDDTILVKEGEVFKYPTESSEIISSINSPTPKLPEKEYSPQPEMIANSFPYYKGITVGFSSMKDAKSLGYNIKITEKNTCVIIDDTKMRSTDRCWDLNKDEIIDLIQIERPEHIPESWNDEFGIDVKSTYNQWINFLSKEGINFKIIIKPKVYKHYDKSKSCWAKISVDWSPQIVLELFFRKDNYNVKEEFDGSLNWIRIEDR